MNEGIEDIGKTEGGMKMNRDDKIRIAYQVVREVAPRLHTFGMNLLDVLVSREVSKVGVKEAVKNEEARPQVATDNEGIRDVFKVGQQVLVRNGTAWVSRKILGITVLRNKVVCAYCDAPMLGEPRFWFKDHGNIPLEEIMADEDIDSKHQETHHRTSL